MSRLVSRRPLLLGAAAALLCAAVAVLFVPVPGRGQEKGDKTDKGDTREPDPLTLVNKPAPAFKLDTLDGKQVALADLKGDVVIVDLWATWCVPCRAAMPHLQELSTNKDLAAKGLKVMAVNEEEEKDDVQEFIHKAGFTFTVLLDKQGTMAKSYQAKGFPLTFVIGRDGKVKNAFAGYTRERAKELDDAVAAAMKEAAPGSGNRGNRQ